MSEAKGPLLTVREQLIGEMRYRVVRRYRDGTYWFVSQSRDGHGKWIPMKVDNQSGRQSDAELRFNLAIQ